MHDVDGAVRQEPLLVSLQGQALPSLALRAAAHSLNLGPADIRLEPGRAVRVGGLRLPTDEAARLLPRFYPPQGGRAAFAVDSFHEVLAGRVPAARFQDRIVVIGATAAGVGASFPTPGHAALSPVELMAHITSAILAGHAVVRPAWGGWAGLAALLAVTLYLMACLPRLSARQGAAATAGLFAALLLGEYLLLARLAWWLELVLPATLLLAGHLALTTRRFLVTEAGKAKSDDESAETNRMMGLALQGQGQLDMAFDRFRRVPPGDALMDNLYHLALDFERKRQFNKAEAVYAHMAAWNPRYKDVPERQQRVRQLSDTVILGGGATHPGGSVILDLGTLERPMLGRYALEKELGKGAMGIVYLGRDPTIGRVVAIKTMALGQEFEGEALAQARERFFREAETAGRLQHPGIVTIHDAGEDQDLAYIAMEFLQGHDLSGHTRAGALLPARQVVEIGARVAHALAYAHRQNVVHRDIKPSNIMWDPATGGVKVTDFGIARITDASRTRTGMVMGTPSFMPPEQLAGRKADGRCDIYALGVTLLQLLTGELPFGGESLAQLMYKIANEPAPDLRSLRPELPEALAQVLARALHKDPDQRYQDADAMAADLLDAMASLPLPPERAIPATADAAVAFDATLAHLPTAAAPPPGR